MAGTEDDLVAVATDPLRADANARALAAMLDVQATLVDVAPAVGGARAGARSSSSTPVRRSAGTAHPDRCAAP